MKRKSQYNPNDGCGLALPMLHFCIQRRERTDQGALGDSLIQLVLAFDPYPDLSVVTNRNKESSNITQLLDPLNVANLAH